ncbi:MAG TPA: sigma-54 factor interaction domain-containing protein, partial [Thermoanaerobaculia bacterium]|nr:sigma-54 factor interaction domain-containing protein [Thermoanaerobaculia bacterium]
MVDPTEPNGFELAGHLWGSPPGASEEAPAGRGFCGIVGDSPIMRELYRKIEMVAGTDVTVLIEGATGTGKNLVARTLHDLSSRASRPFVSLNASNLQEQLFESELFGHVRGAFSGAHQDHEGLARAAQGGTLFIDEVRELSPSNQARLLRFLDTKEVRP